MAASLCTYNTVKSYLGEVDIYSKEEIRFTRTLYYEYIALDRFKT